MTSDAPPRRTGSWPCGRTTRRRDQEDKRDLYADAGVAEYWMVDGEFRRIRAVRGAEPDVVCMNEMSWHPSGATEPLTFSIASLVA